jgi:ElaB/YqjD/DUF883 family membrane-anchored ribosome-binding protein
MSDINKVVDEAQNMLDQANPSNTTAERLRAQAQQHFQTAKNKACDMHEAAMRKSKEAAQATDEYVQTNPWQAVGVVAGVAAGLGMVVGLLLNRR